MNDDERLLLHLRSWLTDEEVALPDAKQAGRLVAAELPRTRQLPRKWWPLPMLARVSDPPTPDQTTDFLPNPIPASNGQTPTVIGRTQSMLSPFKAITAAALVFGIGSVLLIAQPFDQDEGAPLGAATDAAPQPPAEFTGTWCVGPEVAPDRAGTETTLEVGDEGMTLRRNRRGAWRNTVTMSDPRLQGDAYQTYESDRYGAFGPNVVAATLSIVNEHGAWASADYGATFADGTDMGNGPVVLVGEGAYEGLIAVMEQPSGTRECADVKGVIFDGAPVPEPYLPE